MRCECSDGDGDIPDDDPSSDSGYQGVQTPLPVKDGILRLCDATEQEILRNEGFTKFAYASVGNWKNIATVQGSEMVEQELLDAIAREFEYHFAPLIRRFPDKVRDLLDYHKRTYNIVVVYGTKAGWTGAMGGNGMLFKRNGPQDGLMHEIGHVLDLQPYEGPFRSHLRSILSPDDAEVIDKFCDEDSAFIKPDGKCAYSEFVGERYRDMTQCPGYRERLRRNNREIHDVLLKYVPEPSRPFNSIPLYNVNEVGKLSWMHRNKCDRAMEEYPPNEPIR